METVSPDHRSPNTREQRLHFSVDEFGGHSFFANRAGSLGTYISDDGAGSYRLTVRPFAGTRWFFEVDALK